MRLKEQIIALEQKINEYEHLIQNMKNSPQGQFDLMSLHDQCEALRQDTIYLIKDNSTYHGIFRLKSW